jgi:hypothetical protein
MRNVTPKPMVSFGLRENRDLLVVDELYTPTSRNDQKIRVYPSNILDI